MTPSEFLHRVWPSAGLYCLATPIVGISKPEGGNTPFSHYVRKTIDECVLLAEAWSQSKNSFFTVHTLREPRIWNPSKQNPDGTKGGWSVRLQTNMLMARDFFFDLDVGPVEKGKYATQQEALEAIHKFVEDAKMPAPILVSSGGGVHVHWTVSEDVPTEEWRPIAERLKQLGTQHGLKYDPMRTTDMSSVLRVPGTQNWKNDVPRPVLALEDGVTVTRAELEAAIDSTLVKSKGGRPKGKKNAAGKAPPPDTSNAILANRPAFVDNIDSSIATTGKPVAPLKMLDILSTCGQMARLARQNGVMSEPEWYASLGVIKGTRKPEENAIKWSQGDPNFSEANTLAKLEQHRNKTGNAITNCAHMRHVSGPANEHICDGCIFGKAAKGSLYTAVYARATPIKREEDPVPPGDAPFDDEEGVYVEPPVATRATYDPPYPYRRCPTGPGVEYMGEDKDGNTEITTVLPYDFYPLRRVRNHGAKTEQHIWRFHQPWPVGARTDITINADMLADHRELKKHLFNQGVLPRFPEKLVAYMSAYIQHLQSLIAPSEQFNHIGWVNDRQGFVIGTTMIKQDGTETPVSLGPAARDAERIIGKKGTLEAQIKSLEFFNPPEYVGHQLMILMSLASPYFFATDQHGVIVNATGASGASKSTSMNTGAAFWGNPDHYVINALPGVGATANGRNSRIEMQANVPFCFDEMTGLDDEAIRTLALAIGQASLIKVAQTSSGAMRERIDYGNVRSAILMSTSNKSLHAAVATANEAGTAASMRILEMTFVENNVRTVAEANAYISTMLENYGHIGPELIRQTIGHVVAIKTRIRKEMARLGIKADVRAEERFWFAAVATALTIGRIAKKLGLIPFDIDYMEAWVITTLLPSVRGTVKEEADQKDPVRILSDFLEHVDGQIVKVAMLNGKIQDFGAPRAQTIAAHFEIDEGTMWVRGDSFRHYCRTHQIDHGATLKHLFSRYIVRNKSKRFTLGKGTIYAKGQTSCIEVNMKHEEIAGVRDQFAIKPEDRKTAEIIQLRPASGDAAAALAAGRDHQDQEHPASA